MVAAPTEHLAPQRVGLCVFLGAFDAGPQGLYRVEQLLADNAGMVAGNFNPLAFMVSKACSILVFTGAIAISSLTNLNQNHYEIDSGLMV